MRLRYDFDVEKLVQAIVYLASRGVSGLDKLKIAKLLYLADKKHLLEVGRPILGDWYACMPYGPVPSQSLNIIRDVIDEDPQQPAAAENRFREYLTIDRNRKYPAFLAQRAPDLDVFSDSEIEAMDTVIEKFGHLTGPQLIELTHEDPIWRIPDQSRKGSSSVEIPFELFFEVNGAEDMLALALAQQENRDFDSALSVEIEQSNQPV